MKYVKGEVARDRVEAVQITDDTFDAPYSNDEHLIGVIYDPMTRSASVPTSVGDVRAGIGDWIVQRGCWQFEVLSANAFAERHETKVDSGQASQRKRPHAPPRPAASLLPGVRQMPSRCLSGMKHWLLHWQLLQGGYSLTPLAPAAGPLHRDKIYGETPTAVRIR